MICAAALAACAPSAPNAADIARAGEALPADARLAALYTQSCQACHGYVGSTAPLTGVRAHWETRWRQGMPTLREHTISGFNAMPAGGQCFTCTPEDDEALIAFMAGRAP